MHGLIVCAKRTNVVCLVDFSGKEGDRGKVFA